jgi:hypothetical protein
MPKAPTSMPLDRFGPDAPEQDDPPIVKSSEQLRAKLARHNKDAEQLAEAMRRKPKER